MTEMFGEAWSPMSVPDLAPDDDDDRVKIVKFFIFTELKYGHVGNYQFRTYSSC